MPTRSTLNSSIHCLKSIFIVLVFLAFCCISALSPVRAEDDPDLRELLKEWATTAETIQDLLKNPEVNFEVLEGEYHVRLLQVGLAAKALVAEKDRELEPLMLQRSALAGPDDPRPENINLMREREKLDRQIADITAIRNQADREAKRSDALILTIATVRRRSFTESLLTKGPSPANPAAWGILWDSVATTAAKFPGMMANLGARIESPIQAISYALIGILAALIIGIVVQRRFDGSMRRFYKRKAATPKRRFVYAILFTFQRVVLLLAAILIGTIFVGMSVDFSPGQIDVLVGVPIALTVLVFAYALVQAIFAPDDRTLRIVGFDDDLSRALARHILLVVLTLVVDRIVITIGQVQGWPLDSLAAANLVTVLLASYFFYRIAQLVSHTPPQAGEDIQPGEDFGEDPDADMSGDGSGAIDFRKILSMLALCVGLAALVTSLLGYYALSRYFLTGVIRSGAVIGIGMVLFTSFCQVGALTFGRTADKSSGKSGGKTDGEEDEPVAPWWFHFFIGAVLVLLALPLIALIWGASTNDISLAFVKIIEGTEIAGVEVAPIFFLVALAVFPALLFVTRMAKRYLERRVLPRTKLDAGARSSIVAGAGYLGVSLAVLITLSVAGFDLSKLALVAGALSVGIGFGLQNIVGNFVSGLILLIERPIKTGDWVVVGGTHGTVKRIDVRATQIDTFDRSTLIVPNTELITSTVENWTHRNSIGRVIVPIGVAYGTDPLKVQEILLEIAEENTAIMSRPVPQALFRSFGDSALNFELRGYLRDINLILNVENDVCLAIDRRFREEGIEIPFPQQVVHMPDSPELMFKSDHSHSDDQPTKAKE